MTQKPSDKGSPGNEDIRQADTAKPVSRRKRPAPIRAAPTERQAQQRQFILGRAGRLFAELGYSATTVDLIAEATNLNKATIYHYFDSKNDMLFVLLRDAITETLEASAPAVKMRTGSDAIAHLIRVGIKRHYTHLNESKIFVQELPYLANTLPAPKAGEIIDLQRRYMKIVYEVISNGIKSGEFREVDVRLMGSLIRAWQDAAPRFVSAVPWDDMAEQVSSLLLDGLRTAPAPPAA